MKLIFLFLQTLVLRTSVYYARVCVEDDGGRGAATDDGQPRADAGRLAPGERQRPPPPPPHVRQPHEVRHRRRRRHRPSCRRGRYGEDTKYGAITLQM